MDLTSNQPLYVVIGVILAAATVLIGYDVYRYRKYGRAGTISRTLWYYASQWRLGIFLVGLLVGIVVGGLAVHVLGLY